MASTAMCSACTEEMSLWARREAPGTASPRVLTPHTGWASCRRRHSSPHLSTPTPAQRLLSSRIPLPKPILSLLKESAPAPLPPYSAPAPTPPPSYGHRALGLPAGLPPPPETLTPQQAGLQLLPSVIPRRLCRTLGQRSPAEPSEGPLLPSPLGSFFQAHGSLLSRPLCGTFSLFLVSRDQHAQGSVHGPHPSSPQHSFLGARITPRALNIISHTPLWLRSPTPEPQAHLSSAHSTPFPGCPRGTSNPTHTVQSSKICSVSGTDISVYPGHPAKTRVLILESALA